MLLSGAYETRTHHLDTASVALFDGANIMHYSEIIAMFAKQNEKRNYVDI